MKLINFDWFEMLKFCRFWEELPPVVRTEFLYRTKPNTLPVESIDTELLECFSSAGYLKVSPTEKNATFSAIARHFHNLHRALIDAMDVEPADHGNLISMLRKFYSRPERIEMTRFTRDSRWQESDLAIQVGSAAWPARFLRCSDVSQWESGLYLAEQDSPSADGEVFSCARKMLRKMISGEDLISITLIPSLVNESDELAMSAFKYLLKNMLVFFEICSIDITIKTGVWSDIHWFLNCTGSYFPPGVQAEVFPSPCFLVEDMTVLLVETASNTLKAPASTMEFPASVRKQLEKRLADLPEHVIYEEFYDKKTRLTLALNEAQMAGYLEYYPDGSSVILCVTDLGDKWLNSSLEGQTKSVLDKLKPYLRDDRENCYNRDVWGYGNSVLFGLETFQNNSPIQYGPPEFYESLYHAFKSLCGLKEPVSFSGFLKHHCIENNPYTLLFNAGVPFIKQSYPLVYITDSWEMEACWKEELEEFFFWKMVPMGMISSKMVYSMDGKKDIVLSLTDYGKYFLGEISDLELGKTLFRGVLIGDDMRVFFPTPNPAAEAALGKFTERTGLRNGNLLKLSKAGTYRGVRCGLNSAEMIHTLQEAASTKIQEHVLEQVGRWAEECRWISAETRVLINCPDEDTAFRISRIAGKRAEVLSPTTLSIPNRKYLKKLEKTLSTHGIFLQLH